MKIHETVVLPGSWSIQVGTEGGLPVAQFLENGVPRKTHRGPGAARRAFRSYHRADARVPSYEIGSPVEPDMDLPGDFFEAS